MFKSFPFPFSVFPFLINSLLLVVELVFSYLRNLGISHNDEVRGKRKKEGKGK